jgi:hypothetical protein
MTSVSCSTPEISSPFTSIRYAERVAEFGSIPSVGSARTPTTRPRRGRDAL